MSDTHARTYDEFKTNKMQKIAIFHTEVEEDGAYWAWVVATTFERMAYHGGSL
jgi:hypothetical protein